MSTRSRRAKERAETSGGVADVYMDESRFSLRSRTSTRSSRKRNHDEMDNGADSDREFERMLREHDRQQDEEEKEKEERRSKKSSKESKKKPRVEEEEEEVGIHPFVLSSIVSG